MLKHRSTHARRPGTQMGWIGGMVLAMVLFSGIGHAGKPMGIGVWLDHPAGQSERIFAPLVDALGRITHIDFALRPLSGREASLAAFRSGQVDLLLTGPRAYLIAEAQSGAHPLVAFSRPDHYAVVAVRGDLGMTRRSDLKERTVMMAPGRRISEELAPLHLISQLGLDPYRDVSIMRLGFGDGWRLFRRGEIPAIATSYGNLTRLMARDRGFSRRAVRILGRGPDLPGEVLLIRSGSKPSVRSRIRNAFRTHGAVLGAILKAGMGGARYRDVAFSPDATDRDYHPLRTMMAELGQLQFSGFTGKYD